jgi:nucleotide-binding universal stress UspA family protein
MKKILFPTDLSEAANNAFIYALHLADRLEAAIVLLHVYQRPELRAVEWSDTLEELYKTYDLAEFESYKNAIPALKAIQEKAGFQHLSIKHNLKGATKIVETILETAEEETVDLIVMGTTGASGLKEIFQGSIAGEILENANCPVLTVPVKAKFDGKIDNIAMAVSFKEEEKAALKKVLDIIAPFRTTLHCINIDLAHTAEYTDRVGPFAADFEAYDNLKFRVLEGNDFESVLAGFLEDHHFDLLAMTTHKRNFVAELFHYSKTKKMAYHSNTPILAIPTHVL